jgi:hypothetical protein
MQLPCASRSKSASDDPQSRRDSMGVKTVWAARAAIVVVMAPFLPSLHAQPMVGSRGEVTVMVEPYAENVVRVSISTLKESATDAPGYGISAKSMASGRAIESGAAGDVLRSARLTVTVAPQGPKYAPTGTPGRYREVLRRIDSRRQHLHQEPGRLAAGADAQLADVSPELQGRQRQHPERSPAHRRPVL